MKKIAFITLLAVAGLVQVAHGNDAVSSEHGINSIGVPQIPCPEGTYLTPGGDCQPGFDFD